MTTSKYDHHFWVASTRVLSGVRSSLWVHLELLATPIYSSPIWGSILTYQCWMPLRAVSAGLMAHLGGFLDCSHQAET